MRDKHQTIEEPDEVKVSRPVLKTNGVGDNLVEFNNTLTLVLQRLSEIDVWK
ncbi:hypothetical protein [Nostoc sp.]|uniref:hypothetical protein n=1 Tax=Nostoc sp. TaxID=1180 RepID=UPI002FF502BC